MTVSPRILVVPGRLLIAVACLLAWFFVFDYVLIGDGSSLGWQDMLGLAAGTHVVGWGLVWLGLPEGNLGLGPERSRAVLRCACVLMIAAAALVLVGRGQYGQWREYRDAPRCAATERAGALASAGCISEQAAVVESIRIDTSTPGTYNVPGRGQELEIKLADGRKQTASVLQPPWVPYGGPSCAGLFSDFLADRGVYNCKVPVRARLYRGRLTQLILPGGKRTDTDDQPGERRLVAWLGALCLLVALWPLLPLGLKLRRARRTKGRGAMDDALPAPPQPPAGGGLPPAQQPPDATGQGVADPPGGKPAEPWWQRPRALTLGGLVALIVIGAIAAASGKREDKPEECGTSASSTCSPRLPSDRWLRVGGLTWRVTGARTTRRIGYRGPVLDLSAEADGTFLVVELEARSNGYESAILTGNALQLEAGGTTYDPDSDGSFAARGDNTLRLAKEVGPGSTKVEVVFDVPDRVLRAKLFVRVNERNFGPDHGYIELEEPTSR